MARDAALGGVHLRVLGVLARNDSSKGMYGPDIAAVIGKPVGMIHPILARLENDGSIESRWQDDAVWPKTRRDAFVEAVDPPGRPRRRYYRITPEGHRARSEQTAAATKPSRAPQLSPGAKPQQA